MAGRHLGTRSKAFEAVLDARGCRGYRWTGYVTALNKSPRLKALLDETEIDVRLVRTTESEVPRARMEVLYREHGERLWRAVYAYAQDRTIADDAVAEAFTQALHRGSELHNALAWIWRVAFRVAAGELKDRGGRRAVQDQVVDDEHAPIDLLRALARLSPNQRASILLHHYAGFSAREVAQMTGSTPGAVRVHLSVGRRRLRSYLEGDDDDA
jgi:RNA polymerase sigma factor (sigma-70 family)